MKILINTASTFKGGGLQVATSFIEDCKEHPENEYHVILGFVLAKLIKKDQFPENFFFYEIDYRPATRVFSFRSHDKFFKKLEVAIKPDVVFTTTGPAYWRPKAPHVAGYNLPHHIYPESPYLKQINLYRKIRWKAKKAIVKYFFRRDVDVIVVQTEDVNMRLRKLLGKENVITVSNTYNDAYNNPAIFPSKLPFKKPGEFRLITVSAWYPHKNLDIILSVLDILTGRQINNIKFILTLPEDIFEKFFPVSYRQFILNAGPVKINECPSLYKECDAMFLPTLLECFSASYAEAMVIGKPILTSDMGFARTVCDDAAIYFNPTDAADIVNKILSVVNSNYLLHDLLLKGKNRMKYFGTSQQRTKEYLKICSDLVNRN